VGGPTNYKPLRDKVAFELGIPGSTDVNPMTAVAEGASLFAESIDWDSQNHSRKSTRGQIAAGGKLALAFNYVARTPDIKAKIAVQLATEVAPGCEFQIDSVDTGWTSGRLPLKQGAMVEVALTKAGENTFKVFVFDAAGGPIGLEQDRIVVTRTAATVDAIPASHSIGVEVLEKLGGRSVLDYLVRSGDALPVKGKKVFKAAESLKTGSYSSLNLKLWEGEIEDPISDNRLIGTLKISGSDFDDGVIPAGADLECEYEILDSGNIVLEVSVPCIGGAFHSGRNFYSPQQGQLDYTAAAALVIEEGKLTLSRIDEINDVVDSPKLDQARHRLESAINLNEQETETEKSQEAMENVLEARRLLAQVRKEYLKEIRQIDLDTAVSLFDKYIREHARTSEASAFDNLAKTAQRSIDRNDKDFEHQLDELRSKNFEILWRQEWFVIDRFKRLVSAPHQFSDKCRFEELVRVGTEHMRADDIDKLRTVVIELWGIQIGGSSENEMLDETNIIRG
jgi:molecular chaperone DnaK